MGSSVSANVGIGEQICDSGPSAAMAARLRWTHPADHRRTPYSLRLMIELRDYQVELLDAARARLRKGDRRVLIVAPTGSGKTALTATMIQRASSKGRRCMFVVHRRELIRQTAATFDRIGLRYAVIAPGWPEWAEGPVQIASVDSLVRRLHRYPNPDMLVFDEAHHLSATKWATVAAWAPDAIHIGLTATPTRLDGTGLRPWFDSMVLGPTVRWLIDHGWLSRYILLGPPSADLHSVRTRAGDYDPEQVTDVILKPTVVGDVIAHYHRLAGTPRAVLFAPTVRASIAMAENFRLAGVTAEHVDGTTQAHERDAAMARFADGATRILCNVGLFGEGVDVPAIEAAILMNATQSLAKYLQEVGRALRPAEGKDRAYILDHVGNWIRHGRPCDERNWSLEGRPKGKRGIPIPNPIRQCSRCYAISPARAVACEACGIPFERKERTIYQRRDGELIEVPLPLTPEERAEADTAQAQARRDFGRQRALATSKEELIEVARRRGMKRPHAWAHYVWQARLRKRGTP